MTTSCIFIGFVILVALTGCSQDAPSRSLVQDRPGILLAAQQERLQTFQQLLYAEQDIEFMLVILDRAAADLDKLAQELFEEQALGQKTAGARGLLLVVDPFSEQARIEVGYDLEGLFPDGFIAGLEYDQMLPFFQQNRIGPGVEALTELLVARLLDQGEEQLDRRRAGEHLSGGGGARISTSGSAAQSRSALPGTYLPQATPLATLGVYRHVLADRSKDPELEIYTPESRRFFRNWLVTDAQQQNALKELDRGFMVAEVRQQEELAVIRFPVENRQVAPYFLRWSAAGWQLDFAEMNRSIGFNHRNQWHFRHQQHRYMFAFSDWHFDQHGFPHAP